MPYITNEEVKAIRQALKKNFPEFKFSVRKEDHSGVIVALMKGPLNFPFERNGECYEQINHYYIEEHYKEYPEVAEKLQAIYECCQKVHPQTEKHYDCDYGSIPNYYFSLHVGKYNKSFENTNGLELHCCEQCGKHYNEDSEKWEYIEEIAMCKECQSFLKELEEKRMEA
jgi:hypothetical protein